MPRATPVAHGAALRELRLLLACLHLGDITMGIVNSVFLGVGLILLTGPLAAAGDAGSFASREAATDYARGLHLGLMLSGEGRPTAEDPFLQGLRDGLTQSFERLDRNSATALVEAWLRGRFGDFRMKSSYAMGWGSGKQLGQTRIPIDH